MERKYLPTFAELLDRLSIVQLKQIFIPKNGKAYTEEIKLMLHDLDLIIEEKEIKIDAEFLRKIMLIMLTNRYIWENESKVRNGDDQNLGLLKLTHSINGVRNEVKNSLTREYLKDERVDLKIDCLAAELQTDFENWNNIFIK